VPGLLSPRVIRSSRNRPPRLPGRGGPINRKLQARGRPGAAGGVAAKARPPGCGEPQPFRALMSPAFGG